MIVGYFDPDGSPYITAIIKVPRLNAEGTFHFLADTGADNTSLHLRAAVQLLSTTAMKGSIEKIWGMIGGVGGTATYLQEPAQIIFTHVNGTRQGFLFDLDIVKPANWGSRRFQQQLELPSLLGMDILSQFRMVVEYPKNQISLV